ncbi:MAG: ChaN family lipoprotein [Candidatus Krumholzibacteria bacterium]|nr:ChaN family lipoprotein [Candidatus Krumholzibacteria bacterium]
MSALKNIRQEIEAQKKIVSSLREEIFGIDKTESSEYIRRFTTEFSRYRRACSVDDVLGSALKSDIIYFGDYHPLKASQEWAVFLLKRLLAGGAKVVLALEMLYEYQQESLDRWMKGSYEEEEFLRIIDYESEWGFDWENFRPLFMDMKEPLVPVFGIDYEPRDHLKFIGRRDRMIAGKIASIRRFFPGHKILVVIGESHLAGSHLPREVEQACGPGLRTTTIVQNIDRLYWKLMLRSMEDISAVSVGRGKFCIFNASPVIKYQSYRTMLDLWSEKSISESALSSLEEMVENILSLLTGGDGGFEVTGSDGVRQSIDDIFPEVYRRSTYSSFASLLRSRKVSEKGILATSANLRVRGLEYFPGLNIFLMVRFDQTCAAREAARFVLYAMRDEVCKTKRKERREDDRFYAYVFEEGLSWVGGLLVNPLITPLPDDDLQGCIDARGVVTRPIAGFSITETRRLATYLKYHMKREKGVSLRSTKKLREIFSLDIRERLLIIRALGRVFGSTLYNAYHDGRISREELADLFRTDFCEPGSGSRLYLEYIKRFSSGQ